jgi:DNA-binding transcriptional MocR family regulator
MSPRVTGRNARDIAASLEKRLTVAGGQAGQRLPTVRALARELDVSPATVASAYKLLNLRGLTTGSGRRGTRVAQPPLARAVVPLAVPQGTMDLASGNPDPVLLPAAEPGFRAVRPGLLYKGASIDPSLRAFAAAEFEADGIPSRAMALASGALDALERILREHTRAGDRVAVEDPLSPGIHDLISVSGLNGFPLAVDDRGPCPDAIGEAIGQRCRAIIVTPRAQNPTGAAIDSGRAAELRRLLRRAPDAIVIENDYMAPISGVPIFPLRTGSNERWAVIRSTSKFLGADLRVALVAGDQLTISRMERRQALGTRWVSHILQQLTLALWSDPSSGRRLARATDIYTQRRQALQAALSSQGIDVTARSGFNLWIPVSDETYVVQALASGGWAVAAGARFRVRAAPAIRVTASMLEPSAAIRFAADLAAALHPSGSPLA